MKVNIGPYQPYWNLMWIEDLWCKVRYSKESWEVDEDKYDRWDAGFMHAVDKLRVFLNSITAKRTVKVKIERDDLIDCYCTLALVILPTLKAYAKADHSWPHQISEEPLLPAELKSNGTNVDEAEQQAWQWILRQMIAAFEQIINEDWNTVEEHNERRQTIELGLSLFAKYYQNLWL